MGKTYRVPHNSLKKSGNYYQAGLLTFRDTVVGIAVDKANGKQPGFSLDQLEIVNR